MRSAASACVLAAPPQALPASCRLLREMKTPRIFPATTNPYVTTDPALVGFVAQIGFGRAASPDIAAAIAILYYDQAPQNEVGVWALRFKDAQAASRARASMAGRNVLLKGAIAATVWRDGEAGRACQSALEAQLLKNGFAR